MIAPRTAERGMGMVEALVASATLLILMAGVLTVLVQNARVNKSQKMTAEVQANARSCMAFVVQKLRSAGWDPMNAGLQSVALDPDPGDDVSQIEIFADLDMDGLTSGAGEQLLIRHRDDVVEWRPSSDTSAPFEMVAANVSNDADGDGSAEPMFAADSLTDPTRITVRITAQSPAIDPIDRRFIRFTVTTDVVLRKLL